VEYILPAYDGQKGRGKSRRNDIALSLFWSSKYLGNQILQSFYLFGVGLINQKSREASLGSFDLYILSSVMVLLLLLARELGPRKARRLLRLFAAFRS
jgi:hypothetical protein